MPRTKTKSPRLGPADWIAVARNALIAGGINGVKVDRLADTLNCTRGSFYWHFESRAALLDALLDHWESTNTLPIMSAVANKKKVTDRFSALFDLWIAERDFSPAFDLAVRTWGQSSPKVAKTVRRTDERRIAAIESAFDDSDLSAEEIAIRARIIYYHQVGYYALGIRESIEKRLSNKNLYYRVLIGIE